MGKDSKNEPETWVEKPDGSVRSPALDRLGKGGKDGK